MKYSNPGVKDRFHILYTAKGDLTSHCVGFYKYATKMYSKTLTSNFILPYTFTEFKVCLS